MSILLEREKQEQTKQLDKWDLLTHLLEQASPETVEMLRTKFHKKELCINGYANGVYPMKKKVTESDFTFSQLLRKIGFTDKERRQKRMCVVSGCTYQVEGLGFLFNHFIGHHKMPIKNIARLVSVIKGDSRETKHGLSAIKNGIQTSHMGTE